MLVGILVCYFCWLIPEKELRKAGTAKRCIKWEIALRIFLQSQSSYHRILQSAINPQKFSFPRYSFLSNLADLTDLEVDFFCLLLYVLVI